MVITAGTRRLCVGLALLLCVGCAKDAQPPEAQLAPLLPEVRKIAFMGNTHFSSRTLQKQMATQDRPFFPPWKPGDLYNRPTVEADLRRLKKFYFDRGFLEGVCLEL